MDNEFFFASTYMMIVGLLIPFILIASIIGGLFYLVIRDTKYMNESTTAPLGDVSTTEEKKSPAFHMFLFLVNFLSLGFVVAGINTVYFQLINKVIREDLAVTEYTGYFDSRALKFGISSLLVAIPVYFFLVYFINKKLTKEEINPQSVIRKFATYFALFVFSAMGIGSLITLIYNYLDGELTTKFFLKIIVFFVTAAFFFAFYFWEVRRKELQTKTFLPLYGALLLLSVSGLLVGLAIVDAPQVAREKKVDQQKVSDLWTMSSDIQYFYTNNKRLPNIADGEVRIKDGFEYKPLEGSKYQLCTTFFHSSEPRGPLADDIWRHPAGMHCFDLNALSDQPGAINIPPNQVN